MGFLVPLLLGGLAFAGVPWIIHRIRRPTRKPTPFSSLMFVPESIPPVRERKKIEHPWLMLVRMLILVLLAVAFMRPFLLTPAAADPEDEARRRHVILVDTSFSTSPRLETVRDLAQAALDEADREDRVAVIAFDDAPRILAPLDDAREPDAGSLRRAREAIARLAPSSGATRYIPALQLAEQLLRPSGSGADAGEEAEEEVRRVIHLVTDLQRSGLPAEMAQYALARGVSLRVHALPAIAQQNEAVAEVALAPQPDSTLNARVRLRNFGADEVDTTVQLWLRGQMLAEQLVTLRPDSNTVYSLAGEADLATAAAGEVRLLRNDILAVDNTGYFVYQPDPVRDIGVLVADTPGGPGALPFLEAAVADTQPVPWYLVPVRASALGGDGAPEVLVVAGYDDVPPTLSAELRAYVDGGGGMLVIPSANGFAAALTEALFAPAGLSVAGARHGPDEAGAYALLSWIDYDSPIFQAFRSAAYSDFSMVRFQNYHQFSLNEDSAPSVIARLEPEGAHEGDPAIVRFAQGTGTVVAWAFPLDPDWTNLTRTRRFIPMLHETLALLLPELAPPRKFIVGASATAPRVLSVEPQSLRLQLPGADAPVSLDDAAADGGAPVLSGPGIARWYDDAGVVLMEAVNVEPAESDPRAFTEDEFLLRIGAVSAGGNDPAAAPTVDPNVVHWEYGFYVLIVLALAGILETGMAVHYGRQQSRERQSV